MFTGIVQGMGTVLAVDEKTHFRTHDIALPECIADGLVPGASVAHNGCCLTVTAIDGHRARFDLMQETLSVTNLGKLKVGDRVNLERAARFGDEVGGHLMSGHIMGLATIIRVVRHLDNWTVWLRVPIALTRYLFTKGFIGVDGISLTIGEVSGQEFCVHLIPETLTRTIISTRKEGDQVNIEVDPQTQTVVDTVERMLSQRMLL